MAGWAGVRGEPRGGGPSASGSARPGVNRRSASYSGAERATDASRRSSSGASSDRCRSSSSPDASKRSSARRAPPRSRPGALSQSAGLLRMNPTCGASSGGCRPSFSPAASQRCAAVQDSSPLLQRPMLHHPMFQCSPRAALPARHHDVSPPKTSLVDDGLEGMERSMTTKNTPLPAARAARACPPGSGKPRAAAGRHERSHAASKARTVHGHLRAHERGHILRQHHRVAVAHREAARRLQVHGLKQPARAPAG